MSWKSAITWLKSIYLAAMSRINGRSSCVWSKSNRNMRSCYWGSRSSTWSSSDQWMISWILDYGPRVNIVAAHPKFIHIRFTYNDSSCLFDPSDHSRIIWRNKSFHYLRIGLSAHSLYHIVILKRERDPLERSLSALLISMLRILKGFL